MDILTICAGFFFFLLGVTTLVGGADLDGEGRGDDFGGEGGADRRLRSRARRAGDFSGWKRIIHRSGRGRALTL